MKRELNFWGFFGITLLIIFLIAYTVGVLWGIFEIQWDYWDWDVAEDRILFLVGATFVGILLGLLAKMEFLDRYPIKLTRIYLYQAEVYDREICKYVTRYAYTHEHETARHFYTRYHSFSKSEGDPQFTYGEEVGGYETKEAAMKDIDEYLKSLIRSKKSSENKLVKDITRVDIVEVDLRKKKLAKDA